MQFQDIRGPINKSKPTTLFYCGKCNQEMVETNIRPSHCSTCNKSGHNVIFKCPTCNKEIRRFKQNPFESPPCYSCV